MSYVIRNCPAFVLMRTATSGTYFNICGTAKGHVECQDCTDCLLKQIAEKCKHIKSINKTNSYVGEYIEFTQRSPLAEEILDLLDIQECE